MRTRFHPAYLTDGCWSPNRPGLFYVTRKDGWMDIWDYYYRQNEVAFSHKVSDAPLTKIKINRITGNILQSGGPVPKDTEGKYAAIGDTNGTVTLLELCRSLYEPQEREKEDIQKIFDREKKKETKLRDQRAEQATRENLERQAQAQQQHEEK